MATTDNTDPEVPAQGAPPEASQAGSRPAPPSPVRPTPIRRSLGVEATDSEAAPRTVSVDGVEWSIRISGGSGGGRTHTNVRLVEVEFTPVEGEGSAVVCLTVARAPEELSDLQLEELLARHL